MPLSPETYRRLAADHVFRQEVLEKVVRLGEILADVGGDPWLCEAICLRGGTAMNLVHERPPRLSIDLDFDYIAAVEREKMLEDKPQVLTGISRIAARRNYQLVNQSDAPAGTSLRLRYRNSFGTPDEVKVDISWTNRVHVGVPQRKSLWQPAPIERSCVLVAADADLIGGKFRALIDRVAARDVFDAVQLAQGHQPWPPPLAHAAFVFLTGTLSNSLLSYGPSRLDLLGELEATQNLAPMLSQRSDVDILGLKAQARAALVPMLDLTDDQRQFVEALEAGELIPELLFEPETADRLRLHPHLLWKLQNVRRHRGRKDEI